MSKSTRNKLILTFGGVALSNLALAADQIGEQEWMFLIASGFVLTVAILVLVVVIYLYQILNLFVKRELQEKAEKDGVTLAPEISIWTRLNQIFNQSVPVEKEDTILLDHNYDGIKELDNHLPPWFKICFNGGIVFGVVYLLIYHVFEKLPLPVEELNRDLKAAALLKESTNTGPVIDENTVELTTEAANIANGAKLFAQKCAVCHGDNLEGKTGPNLTDEYWINGGGIKNVFRTISKGGRPGKGMIPWESSTSGSNMSDLANYIISKAGSNPANPKAPQGEIWKEEKQETPAESAPEQETVVSDSTNVTQ